MKTGPTRIIRSKTGVSPLVPASVLNMIGGRQEIEEHLPPESIPFENPEVGDLVKKI